MKDVCVHILTRDGRYIIPVMLGLVPFVDKIIVFIDNRSSDNYKYDLKEISFHINSIEIKEVEVKNPFLDLIDARNKMLKMTTNKWIWIVDDDELYLYDDILKILSTLDENDDGYAFQAWSPWTLEKAHKATSRNWADRIFLNKDLKWEGFFGSEMLYSQEKHLWNQTHENIKKLPIRYIHFTHLKPQTWRKELKHERTADGKFLINMPIEIINKIKEVTKIYGYKENLPYVPRHKI